MEMNKNMAERLDELEALCNKYPIHLPLGEAAKYLHTKPSSLQASIENGRCPFAIGWEKRLGGRAAFCVPTLSFYLWVTQGTALKAQNY